VARPPRIARRHLATLGAGFGLAMAGGASAAEPALVTDPSLPPAETPGVPVPPGQIDRAIAQLDPLTQSLLRTTGIPGIAVAVVRDGATVYAKGFGVRKAGESVPVDADTVFQLASLSKSVSATVLARQIGLGGIAWNTPLTRHLPWFALNDAWITQHVTLGDMFAHRSGLADHAGDDLEDLGYDRRQVLERLRWLPLQSFRDHYDYTNFGLTAAAEATAAAAGKDWASLAAEAIYQPLGMSSTSSRFQDFADRENRAVGHVKIGDRYVAKYQRQPDAQSPAGGVSSSVDDMAKWMVMVLQGGRFGGEPLIPSDALLPAVTAQMISDHGASMAARPGLYGFGFGLGTQPSGRTTISHSGGFAMGAATNYLLIPSLGLGIVVLSNAAPSGAVEALSASFADLVQFGAVTRDWLQGYGQRMAGLTAPVGALVGKSPPADPAPSGDWQDYVGVYGNDYFGPAEILRRGDGLVLRIGPLGRQYPLRHWDGAVFVYTPEGENAPDGSVSAVTFASAAPGPISALAIEFYAASGRAEFTRQSRT
jgi:CubicO group peptidase (beta-lactamase class C family)